jgi:endonuclease YncB( thermonuclease family)
MNITPTAFAYSAVLLALLVGVANWIAPHHTLTNAGCTLNYVTDGDTVALDCTDGRKMVRLLGLDTPETKDPGCTAEAALGAQATDRLRALVTTGTVTFEGQVYDKYGRVLAVMMIDGVDVADTLVNEGLAVVYGGERRINWCRKLNG